MSFVTSSDEKSQSRNQIHLIFRGFIKDLLHDTLGYTEK